MASPHAGYASAVFRTQRYCGDGWTSYTFGQYLFEIPDNERMLDDIARRTGASRNGIEADGTVHFSRRITRPEVIEAALSAVMPSRK